MDNNIIDKRTKGEWETLGYSTPDHVKRVFPETDGANYMIRFRKKEGKLIGTVYGYLSHKEEAEANAAFIVKACNEYEGLKTKIENMENYHYAVTDNWRERCDKLKSENKELLEALKELIVYTENDLKYKKPHESKIDWLQKRLQSFENAKESIKKHSPIN